MEATSITNGIAVALSLAAVIVSTSIALRQSRLMHHANLLPVLIDMFREFREPDFKQHLAFVETELRDRCPPHSSIGDLPEDVKRHVIPVMNFFANVGALVVNGIVDDIMAASYMRGSVQGAWRHLAPYIRNERERRNDDTYYLFFEHLAFVINKYPPRKLRKVLNLHTIRESPEELSERTTQEDVEAP